jgi:RimJ/RimL family protein N-acetyltransferase
MEPPLNRLPFSGLTRLQLRAMEPDDADQFRQMTDDPVTMEAIHFLESPFTREAAERLIRGAGDGRDCFWGVWLHETPVLAGTVGTHLRDNNEIEVGYWFSAPARGRGYATESVSAVVTSLAGAFTNRTIYAECRPENGSSWRLLHRIGFRSPGISGHRPGRVKLIYTP